MVIKVFIDGVQHLKQYLLYGQKQREMSISVSILLRLISQKKNDEWYNNTNITYTFEVARSQDHMVTQLQNHTLILYIHHKIKQMIKY